jgi:hypothetical protein
MTIKILSGAHYCGAMIDQSAGATVDSDTIELYEGTGLSVQIDHGNNVGTLVLKGSNDGTTFYAIPDVPFTAISGAGGEVVELGNLRSRFYKFSYTHVSGTGLMKVSVHAKGV